MKSRQTWITIGTALVSFALGVALSPALRKSDGESVVGVRQTKSSDRSPSADLPTDTEEITSRTRVAKRGEKKKELEPRISLPLKTVAALFKEQQWSAQLEYVPSSLEKSLPLLSVSEQEKTEILGLFKKLNDDILAEEKKQLKVFSADETQIRLDNRSMAEAYRVYSQQTQDGIRTILPPDKAEIVINSLKWSEMYGTNETAFPILTIERSSSGRMTAWVRNSNGGSGNTLDPKFADDGTPIPAEEVFKDGRWKPFLKGLTLLPQNEK